MSESLAGGGEDEEGGGKKMHGDGGEKYGGFPRSTAQLNIDELWGFYAPTATARGLGDAEFVSSASY